MCVDLKRFFFSLMAFALALVSSARVGAAVPADSHEGQIPDLAVWG